MLVQRRYTPEKEVYLDKVSRSITIYDAVHVKTPLRKDLTFKNSPLNSLLFTTGKRLHRLDICRSMS
jgi:hypothetical protein